jgi:hypothetical protein
MSMYQVYADHSAPEPDAPSMVERIEPPQPAGLVHAAHAGSESTMCGLATSTLLLYPMHVWESIAESGTACPDCVAAIAAVDG